MLFTFVAILPIFALILLGKFLRHYFYKSDDFWRTTEKMIYYILFPALLINSLMRASFHIQLGKTVIALILATLILALLLVGMQYFLKLENRFFTSIFQGGVRYNSYIFIAVAAALYGNQGVAIVAVIIAYMIVLTNAISIFALDIYIAHRGVNLLTMAKNIAKNPLIIASIIGVLLNPLQHYIPVLISTFLDYLGNASLPLSLLCVGAGLDLMHAYQRGASIFTISLVKLLVLPLLSFILLTLFGVEGLPKAVGVLYAAVPSTGNAYILAQQMGGDANTMAAIISTTVLLSVITIPLVLAFVH